MGAVLIVCTSEMTPSVSQLFILLISLRFVSIICSCEGGGIPWLFAVDRGDGGVEVCLPCMSFVFVGGLASVQMIWHS